ncbi:MAG TPA: BREX-1 system phosphatase PglZ type A, partial [Candidatus Cloacimonadota bacterium]|nr:BREX-1 system phosphatase PglZ type A [Candidatus Cloacimonadota bacterium]
ANLRHLMNTLDISVYSFDEGIQKYLNQFYKLDFQYRKFIYHYQKANQPKLFSDLYEDIENRYLNSYLFPLSTAFTGQMKYMERYSSQVIPLQSEFWKKEISPYLEENKKIFVIISDALRYEIGSELMSQIRQEDRYEAELGACMGMLPSYTQLGMAALLPHEQISIAPDGSVKIDGISSKGSDNRRKILALHTNDRALLLKASDVLSKNADESKKLYRDFHVIYVYQNKIDALGDDLTTESQVFEAVEAAIIEIIELLRKLTSGNANNIVITSDHGFLYQHRTLEDSDFLSETDVSGNVLYGHRRFILGTDLKSKSALMHFASKQLGLHGDIEVMLPLANQRMKRQVFECD